MCFHSLPAIHKYSIYGGQPLTSLPMCFRCAWGPNDCILPEALEYREKTLSVRDGVEWFQCGGEEWENFQLSFYEPLSSCCLR